MEQCGSIDRLEIRFLRQTAVFTRPRLSPAPEQTEKPPDKKPSDALPAEPEPTSSNFDFRLPRNPALIVSIPDTVMINGKPHRIVPIHAEHAGVFYHAESAAHGDRPFWFYDYATSKEKIGVIKTDKGIKDVVSPQAGHVLSFQVLSGVKVMVGDILMLLAASP